MAMSASPKDASDSPLVVKSLDDSSLTVSFNARWAFIGGGLLAFVLILALAIAVPLSLKRSGNGSSRRSSSFP